jgi:choice-of-anchor A domain-containing protein
MLRSALFATALAVSVVGSATAGPIDTLTGVLGSTNLYVLGNLGDSASDRYGSSIAGRTVVGGNAYSSGIGFGSSLVVGGNVDHKNGSIAGNVEIGGNVLMQSFNVQGSLTVGGNAHLVNGSISGPLSVGGSLQKSGMSPTTSGSATPTGTTSIASTSGQLKTAADSLGALASNGSVLTQYGDQLVLTGTDSVLNVFSLTAAQVANLSKLRIEAPAGSTVLINVGGKNVAFDTSFGFELIGVVADHMLFNLYDAESVSMASLTGSLLAPDATVSFAWGALDGAAIVGNLSNGSGNGGAFNNTPFTGTLVAAISAVASVPEPGTLVILCSVLLVFAVARRRMAPCRVARRNAPRP